MAQKSFSTQALIIKRSNYRETDRFVTLLTPSRGKLMVVAKGVRKLNSSKRAFLEPGNIVKALIINTKGPALLTQATLLSAGLRNGANLSKIRQLLQILEIFDKLFVEEELEPTLYALVLEIRKLVLLKRQNRQLIQDKLCQLIEMLGFQNPKESQHKSIIDYVSALSEKKCKSFEYLKV
jgi:DNA repair protein RecO